MCIKQVLLVLRSCASQRFNEVLSSCASLRFLEGFEKLCITQE